MPEYQVYCFAQSGNAYRAALMLNLIGADWEPVFVDFFNGETRTAEYRTKINEMGGSRCLRPCWRMQFAFATPSLAFCSFTKAAWFIRQHRLMCRRLMPISSAGEQIELVQNFAAQAAIAIENTRLLN